MQLTTTPELFPALEKDGCNFVANAIILIISHLSACSHPKSVKNIFGPSCLPPYLKLNVEAETRHSRQLPIVNK